MPLDAAIGPVLARVAPADAMVIDFGIKNRVVAFVDANPLFGHGVAGHKHWFPRY